MSISDQRGKIISMKEFKFCAQQVIKSKRFVNNIQDLLSYIAQVEFTIIIQLFGYLIGLNYML